MQFWLQKTQCEHRKPDVTVVGYYIPLCSLSKGNLLRVCLDCSPGVSMIVCVCVSYTSQNSKLTKTIFMSSLLNLANYLCQLGAACRRGSVFRVSQVCLCFFELMLYGL